MNKHRRKALARALPMIEQAAKLLADARAVVVETRDDERSVYEDLSDGMREGDLGSSMEQALYDMDDTIDGIDAIDLRNASERIAAVAEAAEADITAPTLSVEDLERRRFDRLPRWAKEIVERARAEAEEAARQLVDAFSETDPDDDRAMVIDDYGSPIRGRTIPAERIAIPGRHLRLSVCPDDARGVEVQSTDIGRLLVLPVASNTVRIMMEGAATIDSRRRTGSS